MALQRPTRLGMGPCIFENDHIYQLEMNQCRKEEIIVKGNFGWVWSILAGHPRIDGIVIRECRNEEANFQGSMARANGRTTGQTVEKTTISSRFSKSVGMINC
ncbi:hypothetical protein DPMN_013907 [Dreissena polymorpha]|uniref:Uncharacterized protein n=1 Tax=Dreissena polymorpha TaxID=45954 RepID=A0A9D4NAP2_DREPO|nr:hypothetical protein DPMN_013907 [Dreissena polymorpha]